MVYCLQKGGVLDGYENSKCHSACAAGDQTEGGGNPGSPVSVLFDSLYRQIIMTNSIPYSFSIPTLPTRDSITAEQFDAMMSEGLKQAKAEQGMNLEDAFSKIRENL